MSEEAFESAIEEAKRLEKRMMEYAPYGKSIVLDQSLELEPKEYVELTFKDLVNQYERTQKIISTREMDIFEKKEAQAPAEAPTKESEEVESRLREMTTETLKEAEEIAKEPSPELEKPPSVTEMIGEEIELEKPPEIELEEPKEIEIEEKPGIELEEPPEIELEEPKEIEIEQPEAPEIEKEPEVEAPEEAPQAEEKPPIMAKKAVPPALRESPSVAAEKRYGKMEEQILSMVGEKADELTLKKKMLELTKQLFKEKSVNKREEIKLKITVLKNMLVSAKEKPKAGKKKAETHEKVFDTILSTQQGELAQKKDEVVDSYNKKIGKIKKKFYEDIASAEEPAKRKQIYEGFVFSVTSLIEQLPDALGQHRDFMVKKHSAEMRKLQESLTDKEKQTGKRVEERLGTLEEGYGKEFSAVKAIIARNMDNLIEVTGQDIFKEPAEKTVDKEAKAMEIVKEVNDTDEGTLLYSLHSKDPDYYKRYERKQVSKAEAIFKAKALLAKEKGLSDKMVKKHFGPEDGEE